MTGFTGIEALDRAQENNNPCPLHGEDWRQIFENELVRQSWGIDADTTLADWASQVYAVKFKNFQSGGPGFCGEVIVLLGDTLGNPPLVFCRDQAAEGPARQWRHVETY